MAELICKHNERVELLNQIKLDPRMSCIFGDMGGEKLNWLKVSLVGFFDARNPNLMSKKTYNI